MNKPLARGWGRVTDTFDQNAPDRVIRGTYSREQLALSRGWEARRLAQGKPVSAGSFPKRMPLAERLKRQQAKAGGAR